MDCAYLELYITIQDTDPMSGYRSASRFISDAEVWLARRDPTYKHLPLLRLSAGGHRHVYASPISHEWVLWAGMPNQRRLHHIRGIVNWDDGIRERTRTIITAYECIRLLDLLKAEQWQCADNDILASEWCQGRVTKQNLIDRARNIYGHTARL